MAFITRIYHIEISAFMAVGFGKNQTAKSSTEIVQCAEFARWPTGNGGELKELDWIIVL